MHQKSKSLSYYKCYKALIKIFGCNQGGKFTGKEFTDHLKCQGTIHHLTVHDSPPQNGVSERGMRTQAECARALLIASGLPRFLWEEAMKHSAWLQDRMPARALDGKTPYEKEHKCKPNLAAIQEFGAAAYVKDLSAGKLDARAQKGRFVGYDSESKGYQIYWPKKRSVTVERNIVFNPEDANSAEDIAIIYGEAQSEGEKQKIIQHLLNKAETIDKTLKINPKIPMIKKRILPVTKIYQRHPKLKRQ